MKTKLARSNLLKLTGAAAIGLPVTRIAAGAANPNVGVSCQEDYEYTRFRDH